MKIIKQVIKQLMRQEIKLRDGVRTESWKVKRRNGRKVWTKPMKILMILAILIEYQSNQNYIIII